METLEIDLEIKQGAAFEFDLLVLNNGAEMDLSGFTGKLHVKETVDAATTLAEIAGQITFDQSLMMIRIPGTETATYDFQTAVYDCKISSGSVGPFRVMEGRFLVSRQITV